MDWRKRLSKLYFNRYSLKIQAKKDYFNQEMSPQIIVFETLCSFNVESKIIGKKTD